MTGEENGVPNPKNLTAAARRILPRPSGARAGRGRVPRTPGGTRKGAATLDPRRDPSPWACACAQPHLCFPKREARRERVGIWISCRRRGRPSSPITHKVSSHFFIADSHLPVALTAPSARGCTVCHVGLSRPALGGRRHSTLLQRANSCQLRASPFRVGSSPQHITNPQLPTRGQPPRARLSARLPTIAHVQNHAWGRRPPPFGSFCHPLGEAFLALWGWGSPLVRFPPSPPTPFGARTGRRRCKPPASPHFGGFAEIKHHGGFFPLLRLFLDAFKTKRQPIESPHPRNPPS